MNILFPSERHTNQIKVDPFFETECLAAKKAGFNVFFVNEERIKDAPMFCGMKIPKFNEMAKSLYRGYIIRNLGQYYFGFYHSLKNNNNVFLVNDPQQYQTAQLLSESYNHFNKYMIPSVFSNNVTRKFLKLASKQLQSINLFVKDYVKSEPQYNKIDVRDLDGAIEVLKGLEIERGDMFEHGIVLRPYVDLMSVEYRLWVYKGHILNEAWEKLPEDLPMLLYKQITNFKSDFYTIDLGRYKNGQLVVIETGDGQVSGLKGLNPEIFYNALKNVT